MAVEPREGTEFESEEAAKIFYDDYSRSLGFVMRVMSCRRSERDGRILARRFGCNKEGRCDEKDKRIQELTIELRNKKRLCAAYKEQLDAFAKIVEEYSNRMSKRVESVVENLKEFEEIELELLHSKQDAIYKPALNV
ncbi:hypothetical protein IGI04_017045 [Brassica rapa subsp. trilocularis]|uniref:FAR1 domain-containing protein n=1 Tax=Brassica rapa subsp. trilocularis TaxID=1813537 RepID=A0ABQ7MUP6_BRACM|nr:hypothetical protein IGI04_017045 [Brassica rapa subsp. trilocularis]